MNYSIEDAMEDLDFDDYADYANEDFVIKSEGEEGYDEENSILIANLDWAPMPESISWQDPNFSKDLVSRLKGISEESFAKEVQNWQDAISLLPIYDELEIRNEVRKWDIAIPTKDDYDFESFSASYALQVQYRNRLTEIMSVVFAHYEMISQAHKNLREMAIKLSTGTAKDKEANAAFTVHPFVIPMTNSKRLLTYLEQYLKNIEFAASQMDRILREHQALSRINQSFNNEGMSNLFAKDKTPMNKGNATVRTRNSRI
jgi:hypothetical protein